MKGKLFLIFIFFVTAPLFSQNQSAVSEIRLSEKKAVWKTVSEGKAVCNPVKIPGGFVILHDGNMLTSFSESGKILWKKNAGIADNNSILASSKYGILFYADNKNSLNIINPSGITLNKIQFQNKILNVVPGMDGRFFVFEANSVSCYGMNGKIKWQNSATETGTGNDYSNTENAALLSDGSLFVFKNGNSAAVISPYGEKTAEFEFSAKPVRACSTNSTLFVLLNDRSIKQFSMSILHTHKSTEPEKFVSGTEKKTIFLPQEIQISTGKNDFFFDIDKANANYLVAFDKKTLISFTAVDSKIKKKTIIDEESIKNALFLTDGNFLLCSSENWETSGYKLFTSAKNVIKETPRKAVQGTLSSVTIPHYREILLNGNYGKIEEELLQAVYEILETYHTYLTTPVNNVKTVPPDFVSDTNFLKDVISLSGCFESDYFAGISASLIKVEGKSDLLISLLNSAGAGGFDPNDVILTAIESRLMQASIHESTEIINSICEALYKLSRNMGDRYAKKAAALLSKIVTGTGGIQQKKSAQEAMIKISSLRID